MLVGHTMKEYKQKIKLNGYDDNIRVLTVWKSLEEYAHFQHCLEMSGIVWNFGKNFHDVWKKSGFFKI